MHQFEVNDFATAVSLAKAAIDLQLASVCKSCLEYMQMPANLNAENEIEMFELAQQRKSGSITASDYGGWCLTF